MSSVELDERLLEYTEGRFTHLSKTTVAVCSCFDDHYGGNRRFIRTRLFESQSYIVEHFEELFLEKLPVSADPSKKNDALSAVNAYGEFSMATKLIYNLATGDRDNEVLWIGTLDDITTVIRTPGNELLPHYLKNGLDFFSEELSESYIAVCRAAKTLPIDGRIWSYLTFIKRNSFIWWQEKYSIYPRQP